MTSNCAGAVQSAFRLKVSGVCSFGGVKDAELDPLVVCANAGYKSTIPSVDAEKPTGVVSSWLSCVLRVVSVRNVTKVFNTVVRWIAIDVVNLSFRPFPVDVEPCKPVALFSTSINLDANIPVLPNVPSNAAKIYPVGGPNFPCEYSSVRVVGDKLFKSVRGQLIRRIAGALTKVFNSVVCRDPVDVHKPCSRDNTKDVNPNDVSGCVNLAVNIYSPCFTDSNPASSGANIAVLSSHPPSEVSGSGIVMKKLFKAALREGRIQISHAVSPLKKWFGQRPGSVSALAGLRHFKVSEA